jgi:prolyl-tRNA synthetase
MSDDKKLTTRAEDFSAWYNELVLRSELADYSPVKGSMVIRPNGYGIWERMQRALDDMFKASGHVNAYFPLFIPQSFIAKEAKHVEGFAPELAIVTHGGGKELEEPLVVRPTSETIIYHMYAKWVQSYRDLPILINQWANVVRWEMRTRLFLRTLEFLWQEGHTAHATHDEAEAEALTILGIYRKFAEEWMGMPVITGLKTENEKFAGALRSYCIEAMMQDNKALQAGTSHNLGQNFARVFDLKFQSEAGQEEFAWNTSWGVSTRLIGGLVMTHDDEKARVIEAANKLKAQLGDYTGRGETGRIRTHVDAREGIRSGAKYYEWELRGVPLRLELGPKDLEKQSVFSARRDTRAKAPIPMAGVAESVAKLLDTIHADLFVAAKARREAKTVRGIGSYGEFKEIMNGEGAFVYAGWNGDPAVEAQVKEETKATIRCIPTEEFRSATAPAKCLVTGQPAKYEVVWAKAY